MSEALFCSIQRPQNASACDQQAMVGSGLLPDWESAATKRLSWEAISAVLDELLETDAVQRATQLAQLKAKNPALAEQVAALLSQEQAVASKQFLEGTACDPWGMAGLPGRCIGSYTFERPLGQGGMGSVWLARCGAQHSERHVAFKFPNLALLGRGGAERLQREAQVLAKLSHPNITRLIEAGVIARQPYLVMEYVDGQPIDRWCEQRGCDVPTRIRIFLQVLAAIAHAHERQVLHRDLKPSNILVTSEGCVKLLDFGIAKLLEGQAQLSGELTPANDAALTPDYAAPEQVLHADVTPATDVYALGVLLYVLLTGAHPTADETVTPAERLRAVVEREPLRLSEAVRKTCRDKAVTRGLGRKRQLQELECILAKALQKSASARYPTALEFAQDLRRYLDHESVLARAGAQADSDEKSWRGALPAQSAAMASQM